MDSEQISMKICTKLRFETGEIALAPMVLLETVVARPSGGKCCTSAKIYIADIQCFLNTFLITPADIHECFNVHFSSF
jgi:hypothetical protein